jgi:aspartyl-tRNA(Asn)/glutamyl-tRNA(Gln) amidotransferase subunit C
MNTVDTSSVDPLAHPLEPAALLRPDEVTERNLRDVYQAGAPRTENGLYLVPKVID